MLYEVITDHTHSITADGDAGDDGNHGDGAAIIAQWLDFGKSHRADGDYRHIQSVEERHILDNIISRSAEDNDPSYNFV